MLYGSKYDLVIEQDGRLKRVQCKYTSHKVGRCYEVPLRTYGRNTHRIYQAGDFDLLYILTAGGEDYLIPAESIIGKSSVRVGRWRNGNAAPWHGEECRFDSYPVHHN